MRFLEKYLRQKGFNKMVGFNKMYLLALLV